MTKRMTDEQRKAWLIAQWDVLSNIAIDDNDCLEEGFLSFYPGTHREIVWAWFDSQHPDVSVAGLMGVDQNNAA